MIVHFKIHLRIYLSQLSNSAQKKIKTGAARGADFLT